MGEAGLPKVFNEASMSKFRKLKAELAERLAGDGWEPCLEEIGRAPGPREYIGPLTALLPRAGLLRWRAVLGLGAAVPALALLRMEEARTVMRRFMWHLNEESGNLGWGIPESLGEILSRSEALAAEFNRILFSYVLDSGREDNYIDYAPLLRGCFWGAGRLARARPDLGRSALGGFVDGLGHEDGLVRAQAALALLKLLEAAPELARCPEPALLAKAVAYLRRLESDGMECEDFDGVRILYPAAGQLAGRALGLLVR